MNYNHYLSIFEAFSLLGEVFSWRHNLESSFPCYQSNGFYLSGFYLSVCNIASARFESSLAALGCPCLISQAEKWQMVAKWDIWGSKKNLFKTITLQKNWKIQFILLNPCDIENILYDRFFVKQFQVTFSIKPLNKVCISAIQQYI